MRKVAEILANRDCWPGLSIQEQGAVNRQIACCTGMWGMLNDGYPTVNKSRMVFMGDYWISYCPFCKASVHPILAYADWVNYQHEHREPEND